MSCCNILEEPIHVRRTTELEMLNCSNVMKKDYLGYMMSQKHNGLQKLIITAGGVVIRLQLSLLVFLSAFTWAIIIYQAISAVSVAVMQIL